MTPTASARSLAALLGTAGALHFLTPSFFDAIVPRSLPGAPRTWTHLSGVAELVVAGAVANPATRQAGAAAAAALFVAVFPANVKGAFDAAPGIERAVTLVRLPLQVPLVIWALRVSRSDPAPGSRH